MRRASTLLLVLLAVMPHVAVADDERVDARALTYLASTQTAQGEWAAPPTAVVEAVASMGLDAKEWPTPARSAFAQLAPSKLSDENDRYRADLRTLYAASVAGYGVAAVDQTLVTRVREKAAQGGDPARINDEIWLVLALRASGAATNDPLIAQAVSTIQAGRCPTGGWGYIAGAMCSSDMTGMALAALDAAGEPVRGDEKASAFLASLRDPDGGYRDNPQGNPLAASVVNIQSSAWAITALRLLGEDTGPATRALARQQHSDGGFPRVWNASASNDWATAEAIVALTSGHPMKGLSVGRVQLGPFRALQPIHLTVEGAYDQVEWTIDGAPLDENAITFPRAGAHAFGLHAMGASGHWRTSGQLLVLSARPIVVLPATDIAALRNAPVTLDLSASHDPDGAIVAYSVDWGDGAPTTALDHAYALPGDRVVTVRAQDDAGEWSHPASLVVHVANRAPLLDGIGAVRADRVHDVTLAPSANDPDGDAVRLTWTSGNASGEGAATLRFATLGEHVVRFVAEDSYGGNATAEARVLVENLPPRLENVTIPTDARADVPTFLAAIATDEDGHAPELTWTVGNATLTGARVNPTLPAGDHPILVEVRDVDGGVARANATLHVRAADAPAASTVQPAIEQAAPPSAALTSEPARVAPVQLGALAFAAAPRAVLVNETSRFVLTPLEGADEYRYEFGDGNATGWSSDASASHTWARAGDVEVRAFARAADGRSTATNAVVHVVARTSPQFSPAPTPEQLEPTTVAQPTREEPEAQLPAAHPRREAPGPSVLALLLLAALGTLPRRGAR